ncbi:MAG: hypothetical protein P1V97_01370, partial [Planctomycetota bacterium]|nr:hypothetical protein [Planctomycetota bacterium]
MAILKIAFYAVSMLLYGFIYVGLIFNGHGGGSVLGKYSPLYFTGLVIGLICLYPFARILRFLVNPTTFTASTGDEITISVLSKFKMAGILFLLAFIPCELVIHHQAVRRPEKMIKKFHPFLQLQGRPNRSSTHSNDQGFRGEPISVARTPGKLRIMFMGGSTVYCMRTIYNESHPRRLELLLQEKYPDRPLELQNTGVDWYTTQHSLSNYLFRIKDFKPDIIILFHGINDLVRSFSPETLARGPFRSDYGHYYGPVSRLILGRYNAFDFPHPYVVGWLAEDLLYSDLYQPEPTKIEVFPSLKSFERNLKSLITILKADKVKLVLATQSSFYKEDMKPEESAFLWMNNQF